MEKKQMAIWRDKRTAQNVSIKQEKKMELS